MLDVESILGSLEGDLRYESKDPTFIHPKEDVSGQDSIEEKSE